MARNKKNNRVQQAQTEQVINNVSAYAALMEAHKNGKCRVTAVPSGTYVYKVQDSISFLRRYAVAVNGTAEGIWDSTKKRYVISKDAWDAAKKGFVRVVDEPAPSDAPIEVADEPMRCYERILSYEPEVEVSRNIVVLTFDEMIPDLNVEPELAQMGFEYMRSLSSNDFGDVYISTNLALWRACAKKSEERKDVPTAPSALEQRVNVMEADLKVVKSNMSTINDNVALILQHMNVKQTFAQQSATNSQPTQRNTRRGLGNVSKK